MYSILWVIYFNQKENKEQLLPVDSIMKVESYKFE